MQEFESLSEAKQSEALSHARAILMQMADLRLKNINFFLIIIAIIVAGIINTGSPDILYALCFLAVVMSLFFFLADLRHLQFMNYVRNDLEKLEPLFGLSIHASDRPPSPRREMFSSYRGRWISNTYTFRAMFLIFALAAIGCAIATITGFYDPGGPASEEPEIAASAANPAACSSEDKSL